MDRRANEALKERLRRDAVDPAKAEARRVTIAAKQAKRMRGVVVEIRRKRLNGLDRPRNAASFDAVPTDLEVVVS
ncbi:hypothetical protein [Bradyrhizobium sp. ERR14]|uniref:hypothetical protein n=1 Tax=Bradyrhizobium sp. ERR14 TaxID=2663837 RepID=UPI001608FEFA|nr:hypothetical protein [Bradyrhizobium sp. ERR14]MBB4398682.1 hypothetical protein [Bradyrhizobium sp. ERR14]